MVPLSRYPSTLDIFGRVLLECSKALATSRGTEEGRAKKEPKAGGKGGTRHLLNVEVQVFFLEL